MTLVLRITDELFTPEEQIEIFRKRINSVDESIIGLLIFRKEMSSEIIRVKKNIGLDAENLNRESEIKRKLSALSGDELNPELIGKIYSLIFEDAKK